MCQIINSKFSPHAHLLHSRFKTIIMMIFSLACDTFFGLLGRRFHPAHAGRRRRRRTLTTLHMATRRPGIDGAPSARRRNNGVMVMSGFWWW